MGGFLQALVSGYGGVRIYSESFEIYNSVLPENTKRLLIKGNTNYT